MSHRLLCGPELLLGSYPTSDKQHWQRTDKITQCEAGFNYAGHHIPFNLQRSDAPAFATQDSAADALRRLALGSEAEAVNDSIYTPEPFRERSLPQATHIHLKHSFGLCARVCASFGLLYFAFPRLCANILLFLMGTCLLPAV